MQFSIWRASFASLAFSRSQVAFLASSSELAFSTSALSSFTVFSLVYFSRTFFFVCDCSTDVFGSARNPSSLGDPLAFGDVALELHPFGPVDAVLGRVSYRTGPSAISPRIVSMFCLKTPSTYSVTAIFGNLAGQPGVLIGGLGALGGDHLIGQRVSQRRGVEFLAGRADSW